MADDVRNEILAASRSRTGSKDLSGPVSSRRFTQVKAAFDTSPTAVSPERTFGGKPRSRQSSASSSPPRSVSTSSVNQQAGLPSGLRSPPPRKLDIPTAAYIGALANRWGKKDDKQSHTDRFKNSRAMFEKLEKENSAPNKPLDFKAGTSFGAKLRDLQTGSKFHDRRGGAGEPTSYSANAAQMRTTTNLINTLNNMENGSVPPKRAPNSPKNGTKSSEKGYANGHPTNGHSSTAVETNGGAGQAAAISPVDDVFIEPRSEPALNKRHLFNRQLSSEVLPKPYHAPKVEIRSVRRPTSASHLKSNETTPTETINRSPPKSRPPIEKSLSKDDIAASLAAADKYLNKIHSGSPVNQMPDDDELPWRSSSHQVKDGTEKERNSATENSDKASESVEDNQETDESVSYDNVADVLSELQATGHVKPPNTQKRDSSVGTKPMANENIVNASESVQSMPAVAITGSHLQHNEPYDYDSVASSTHSVYLESKLEHTYNNIGEFLENKKRLESTSDDEPYEIVAPPTPPSRRHPANLPLAEEVDPEPMSSEEAQQFLSTNRTQSIAREALPEQTIVNAEESMFGLAMPTSSVPSGISLNVDRQASETDDRASSGIILNSQYNNEYEEAETASVHSDSTDGGGAYAVLNVKPETIDIDPDERVYPGDIPTATTRVSFLINLVKVFDTYSAEDYDRHNEFIDPVAASAEYELEKRIEKMNVFRVDIVKGSEGLGLSIIGMGVGADAGLEKLGIFIKNLFPGGAAHKDGRMQVNDQIIEVDDKSLVGVTQAYAATVLRNTSGNVRFVIGREKNPGESEVARLIEQSIAEDKIRDDMRQRQQEAARQHLLRKQQNQRARQQQQQQQSLDQRASSDSLDSSDRQSRSSEETLDVPPPLPAKGYSSSEKTKIEPTSPTPIQGFDTSEDESGIAHSANGMLPSTNGVVPNERSESTTPNIELAEVLASYQKLEDEINIAKERLTMMEDIEAERDVHKERCVQLESQLEISQKIVDTQEAALAAKEEERQETEKKYMKAKKIIKEHEQKNMELVDQMKTLKSKISRLEEDNRHVHSSNSVVREGIEAFVDSENESLSGEADTGPSVEDMNVTRNLAQPLLDNSYLKLRSHLAHGAVAKRRPPSKVASYISNENDKNSNNVDKGGALPRYLADERHTHENIVHPLTPGRKKNKTPTKEVRSDDSDSSSGLFGAQRVADIPSSIDNNPSRGGGIMLISTKPLQGSEEKLDSSTLGSQELRSSTSSLDEPTNSMASSLRCYSWTTDQVGQWLYEIGLSHLVNLFMQNSIDGKSLWLIDSARIKQMGVGTKDRATLKKRLKELRAACEKERKQMEKDQKSKSPVTQKKKSKSLFARF